MEIQDSFLLDEVRCGFMIPAAIKQAWAANLEVLMEIDRVCKKHNIQYFADWGTLLGAVRHGGFIPWDDDLDIVMKREDYIKFMKIARFDMEEGFDVQTFWNQDDYWEFMGKVVGRNGFSFEEEHLRRFHNFPYIACVDIFVLDYVYKDPEKEEKRRTLCKYILAVADSIVQEQLLPQERESRLNMLEEMSGKKFRRIDDPVEMARYLYGEIETIFAEVSEHEADMLTQLFPWGLKGKDFQFPKEYYEQTVSLPFESTQIPVSMMYDKMLRKRYGDYCRIVKEWSGHDYPFFEGQKKNLQKVLDFPIPEFRVDKDKIFRTKEEEECKNFSYKVMTQECTDELWKMKEQLVESVNKLLQSAEDEGGWKKNLEYAKQTEYRDQNITYIEAAEQCAVCMEQVLDLLQASQQLAIDFGNMLEQFLGEGCLIIRLLEQYCETLYTIYELLMADDGGMPAEAIISCSKLEDIKKEICVELNQSVFERKTVLILPVLAKDWNGLYNLWKEASKDLHNDVYVVPLPYYYKDYDGSPRKICCDVAEFPEDVPVSDYNLLTAEYLEMLHPETIIIQNPYDSWNTAISIPEMFYSVNIRKYTDELIYVPPFILDEFSKHQEREYSNMKYYVMMPGVVYADHILVQSESMRQIYIEKLTEFAGEETKEVWESRVKVSELPIMEREIDDNDESDTLMLNTHIADDKILKKKMLYGISFGVYIGDVEAAKSKIERNLQLFEECKEKLDLTIQIFPENIEDNEMGDFINNLLNGYSAKIAEKGFKCNAKDFDAYYGDAMPLVMEFRDAGKPVMVQDIYI